MKPIITASVLLFLFSTINLNAQTQISTVDEAINIALQNNQSIKAKGLDVEATKSLKKTANELPKMDFNAQLGQYNSIKFDNAFQLSQTIPFPTLFGAKKELINAEIKGKEWQQQISINELKSQVRSYFYQIQYLQYNKIKLQYLDSLYIEFIRLAKLRYKTGDTKKIEISTAETKQGEIKLLYQQNEIYLENALANFKTLLHSNESIEIKQADKYQPLQISTLLDSSTIANHPGIQALYQQATILEQTKKVEKAQGMPDFKLGYSNQSLIGFQTIDNQEKYFGGTNRFHVVNIGVAIPLTFGATKAKIKSLDYQKQSAEAMADYQKSQMKTQLQNILSQYEQDVKQYQYYVENALPNADEIIKSAQLGYTTGEINYVEYLYALQTATDVQLKYLQAIQQINQTVTNINFLINK